MKESNQLIYLLFLFCILKTESCCVIFLSFLLEHEKNTGLGKGKDGYINEVPSIMSCSCDLSIILVF